MMVISDLHTTGRMPIEIEYLLKGNFRSGNRMPKDGFSKVFRSTPQETAKSRIPSLHNMLCITQNAD